MTFWIYKKEKRQTLSSMKTPSLVQSRPPRFLVYIYIIYIMPFVRAQFSIGVKYCQWRAMQRLMINISNSISSISNGLERSVSASEHKPDCHLCYIILIYICNVCVCVVDNELTANRESIHTYYHQHRHHYHFSMHIIKKARINHFDLLSSRQLIMSKNIIKVIIMMAMIMMMMM